MKKTIFATISNVILAFISAFFIASILTSKSIGYPINLVFGLFIALIVLLFSIIIAKSNVKKRKEKLSKEQKIARIVYALSFLSRKKGLSVFYPEILKRDKDAKLYQNKIVLSSGTSVYNLFSFSPVTKADLVRCFNLSNAEKSVILCDSATKEVKDFATAFKGKIVIIEKAEIFKNFPLDDIDLKDTFIPIDFNKKTRPTLSALISKKNAGKILAFGMFFLLMSFFVPIKLYYVIVGSIMLVFSSIVLIFSKRKA